jgi:hypothetical protein
VLLRRWCLDIYALFETRAGSLRREERPNPYKSYRTSRIMLGIVADFLGGAPAA